MQCDRGSCFAGAGLKVSPIVRTNNFAYININNA